LGVEKFIVEVAEVFKADVKRLMRQHGYNNQQEVHQTLLRNVIAADFEISEKMLRCVTAPSSRRPEVARRRSPQSQTTKSKDPHKPASSQHPASEELNG
jgi:uncharacterized glyoxalase superfamily protein PhnB